MKIFGIVIIIGSLLLGFYAFNMETSVYSGFGRVSNISLMNQQQNYLYVSGLCLLVGIILFVASNFIKKETIISEQLNLFEEIKTEKGFNFKLPISNEVNFLNVKSEILEFYKQFNFNDIKTDEENSFLIKNSLGDAYIELKYRDTYLQLSVYNTTRPIFIDNYYKEKVSNSNNQILDTDKLIELSKMLEKGLITKEEFEEHKRNINKK